MCLFLYAGKHARPAGLLLVLILSISTSGCWRKVISLTAGGQHNCGLRRDGTVICWGRNDLGQCNAPGGKFVQVSAGDQHSCAATHEGRISCWGSNSHGQCDSPPGTFK